MEVGAIQSQVRLYLGVDGGGTKTKVLLGRLVGVNLEVLGAGQAGPSNPRAVGFEIAFSNINQAVHQAFRNAGIVHQTVDRACLCLAGAGRDQERVVVEKWAGENGLARQAQIVNEAEAVLASIERDSNSITEDDTAEVALICGTGSLAWGRKRGDGQTYRSGGWGYLLGDEGSGFWLGQQWAQLACRAADGRNDDCSALASLLGALQLDSASELVSWCYGDSNSREKLATFAPLLFAFQEQAWARNILLQGAQELAESIAAVLRSLEASSYELACAGSVILAQTVYQQLVINHLEQVIHLPPRRVHLVKDPVQGALRLAAKVG